MVDGKRLPPIEFHQPSLRRSDERDEMEVDALVCARCCSLALCCALGMGSLEPLVFFEKLAALGWREGFAPREEAGEGRFGGKRDSGGVCERV
jgi:hypothetical protein